MFHFLQTRVCVWLTVACAILFARCAFAAENISPLGTAHDWDLLARYQKTMTRDDFSRLLESVYCPNGAAEAWIKTEAESARILKSKDDGAFTIRFATSEATRRPRGHSWATRAPLKDAG